MNAFRHQISVYTIVDNGPRNKKKTDLNLNVNKFFFSINVIASYIRKSSSL